MKENEKRTQQLLKNSFLYRHLLRCNKNLFLSYFFSIVFILSIFLSFFYFSVQADNNYLITCFIGLVLLMVTFLFYLKKKSELIKNPMSHSIIKLLQKQFGSFEDTVSAVDYEIKNSKNIIEISPIIDPVIITESWMIHETIFGLTIIDLFGEVVWVYKKITRHSINFIPYWIGVAVVIETRNNKRIEISCDRKKADYILYELASRMPWAIVGFEKELSEVWGKKPEIIISFVDNERKKMLEKLKSEGSFNRNMEHINKLNLKTRSEYINLISKQRETLKNNPVLNQEKEASPFKIFSFLNSEKGGSAL